ncbi:uroporphyrinogen-III C-methyltransferase [Oryzifoliimicrobium ureilyticus]|uniref:uroporphyrinogen-III C-methyltransferase n=1 Tax=Oryzifoliimicrobium ureilyticus TaxID=3113724 RepID=UPI0030766197
MIDTLLSTFPTLEPGSVWLVGAGPGDPGLLTLMAMSALRQADVIVYDALVDENCLKLAGSAAELIYAGKRGGTPSPLQRDISMQLVEFARAGKRVLRLKGGDPFVFGRGGEEALTLVEYNIPFRVVPGITAGIGGLAYAGIPVTHRDVNHAVTFLTGHDSSGLVPDMIDWAAIAKASPVIVMYMVMKHLDHVSAELMKAGRRSDEPVAIAVSATTAKQQVLETTLGGVSAAARSAGLRPPAIVVVGEVVRLRSSLDWMSALSERRMHSGDWQDQLKEGL